MNLRFFILIIFLLTTLGTAFGQNLPAGKAGEKSKKFRKKQVSNTELLEQATALQSKNPKEAIRLVEQVLGSFNSTKKKQARGDWKLEANAYTLLGDIFEDIEQNELALQRYQQALNILQKTKERDATAEVHFKRGKLFLEEKNDQQAASSFTYCVKFSTNKTQRQLCEEGLADVELLRGNVEQSFSQLDEIESNYELDSLSQSRVEAKRSQGYNQQNDYSNAYKTLENSVNTLPKNKPLAEKDMASVEKAKQEIFKNDNINAEQKIEVSSNLNYGKSTVQVTTADQSPGKLLATKENTSVPSELQIRENLQLATLYEDKENLVEAEKFIKISKDVINEKTAAASVADVYKKSAELNRKKGALDAALLDLEKYTRAKEQAITNLEEQLKTQVDIVKGQQKIDLGQKDFDLEAKESELLGSQLQTQKIISGFLGLLLFAALGFFYFLNKNVKAKRRANQLLLVKSLRTQMNPHFIFNALNSVNNFIAKNDEKAANKFLSEFSRLMRKVLDYSQRDFISFEEEIELNELYLKLEHFRFRDKFEYQFEKNTSVNTFDLEVPPMLIQPFIENAVWHGLRYKEGKGHLKISIEEVGEVLLVKIQDDGIGRAKSKALKTKNQKKYKSTGLENVAKRVALINEIYGKNYSIEVSDLNGGVEETGTLVEIKIPKG